jgi:hypothetical protein
VEQRHYRRSKHKPQKRRLKLIDAGSFSFVPPKPVNDWFNSTVAGALKKLRIKNSRVFAGGNIFYALRAAGYPA